MKKVISILMTLAFMFAFITGCTAAESDKQALDNEFLLTMQIANPVMTVNGQEKNIDDDGTAPTIVSDRTLVPVRAIIESMGGSVNWDSDTSTAMLEYNNDIITLTIGSETAYFNDNANTLDTAPQIINDRIMLPIRFIAESFKFDVEWEQGTQTITIKSNTLSLRDVELASTTVPNWDTYDTVFIGYPIWWGIAAWPTDGFVKANDFTGKTVIPFCTSASSEIGDSGKLLEEEAGTGNWLDGMRFRSSASEDDVKSWVDGLEK